MLTQPCISRPVSRSDQDRNAKTTVEIPGWKVCTTKKCVCVAIKISSIYNTYNSTVLYEYCKGKLTFKQTAFSYLSVCLIQWKMIICLVYCMTVYTGKRISKLCYRSTKRTRLTSKALFIEITVKNKLKLSRTAFSALTQRCPGQGSALTQRCPGQCSAGL